MKTKIPLTTLALLTTAGCGGDDPMLGSWDCTSLTYANGGGTPCPLIYSDSAVQETTYAYGLDITSDTDVSFVSLHIYDYAGTDETFYLREFERSPATATVLSKGTWAIEASNEIDFECTAAGNAMTCTGTFFDEEVTMELGPSTIERSYTYDVF